MDVLGISHAEAATLFAATLIVIAFFLIARVARARQPVALAFAAMPLLLVWALPGLATAVTSIA